MTNYDILKEYEAHKTPVPSYEEWRRTFHYAGKYEHEYTSCVIDYENLKEENQQLKFLLKECRYKIIADLDNARLCESSVDIEDFEYLLNRIDNAIGEK